MLHSVSERMYLTLELKFQLHSSFLLLDEPEVMKDVSSIV